MTDAEEAALLQRAMQHDRAAYAALVQHHQGRVRGFLRRLCRDHAQADDLAQECFLLAWRRLPDLREHASLGAWLCRIAYRCFLQARRTRERQEALSVEYAQQSPCEGSAEPQVDSVQQRELERALLQLSPQEAAAISLHFTLGHSHSEIADILSLPLGTVKSLIARGLPKLRALLSSHTGTRHGQR